MPMNYAKTAMLLVVLTAIFVAMGAVIGGKTGLIIAFVVALVMNLVSLWKSDTVVLRMFKAQEVTEREAPDYYNIVREMAARAELPMPRVYVLPSPQPNAFATGRNPENSAVAASTGLLDALNREELAGVIAHELAHIKNRDTLTMSIAATIGGAISMFAQYMQFGLLFGSRDGDRGPLGWVGTLAAVIAAPFAAMLVQMAISRSREYQADRLGAMICGNPRWLSSALQKIEAHKKRVVNQQAEAIPAAAHMFIINPLTGQGVDNWFSTHPNTQNRIAALEEMAREWAGRHETPLTTGTGHQPRTSHAEGPWDAPTDDSGSRGGPWG